MTMNIIKYTKTALYSYINAVYMIHIYTTNNFKVIEKSYGLLYIIHLGSYIILIKYLFKLKNVYTIL